MDSLTLPIIIRLLAMLKEVPPVDFVVYSVIKNLTKDNTSIASLGVPVKKGKIIGGHNG